MSTPASRRPSNVSTISSWVSPSPTIRPDLVLTSPSPIALALRSTRHDRGNVEPRRAIGYSRGTTSTLWLKTSGRSARTVASGISWPRKSGASTPPLQPGARRRAPRRLAAALADRGRPDPRALVGQVVAVDAGDHRVAQAHPSHRPGHPRRLERV